MKRKFWSRLLRAAIYHTPSLAPIVLEPEDVAELDEVYITAGLKGNAGGLELEREPRKRGLKRRGRGTWDSDRLPVFGLPCRGGEARLFVLRNVQTATIRPIVEQMVQRGARVYTDGYSIYHFLSREGYQHRVVNHGAGEYALDLDGDGICEVHCNTMECTWSWLRQMIRTYRGVSKVYFAPLRCPIRIPFQSPTRESLEPHAGRTAGCFPGGSSQCLSPAGLCV